jgi:hypothetical protein
MEEIRDKVVPMLNYASVHEDEYRSRDITPHILSFDTEVEVNVQLHAALLQRWGTIPQL